MQVSVYVLYITYKRHGKIQSIASYVHSGGNISSRKSGTLILKETTFAQ